MLRAGILAATLLAVACAQEEPRAPREVFRWSEQQVSFTPPTDAWYREGELSGGVRGVRFVKKNGGGQAITVGELHRGRRPEHQTLSTTLQLYGKTYHRREMYLEHAGHVFTVRFIGLEESLPLFDRVASSIEFPQ